MKRITKEYQIETVEISLANEVAPLRFRCLAQLWQFHFLTEQKSVRQFFGTLKQKQVLTFQKKAVKLPQY